MRKKHPTEHKKLTKIFNSFDNKKIFIDAINMWTKQNYSLSKIHRRLEILSDIVSLHGYENAWTLYDTFIESNSRSKRIEIRYGRQKLNKFKDNLKQRKRGKISSCWTIEYWTKKGLNEKVAQDKISQLQSENCKKRSKESFSIATKKLKITIEYWLNKGYTIDEAKILRDPYLSKNTLEGFISRHGKELGEKKYFACIEKYKKTMKENLGNKKSAGFISQESKTFFIKIYKFCRKLGIKREDIYFGVKGSREFFVRKDGKINEGRFVDFCIPKLNLCVEYNGVFWHPRNLEEWKNPFYDFNSAKQKEDALKILCEKRNLELIYVWSDEDKNESIERIRSIIHERIGLYSI